MLWAGALLLVLGIFAPALYESYESFSSAQMASQQQDDVKSVKLVQINP
ncbi:MAG: hypothetical protein RJA35_54 [Actinomycetota bacterium]